MAQENEEVKEFVHKVSVSPSQDEEETEDEVDEEDESETQSLSSDDEKDSEEEETEAEEDEESDEEAKEESDQEVEEPEPKTKAVEGETPRERALRLEVTRVKGLLRKERQDDLFVKAPGTKGKTIEDNEELSEYDPEELERVERMMKLMGYVKKDEIAQENIAKDNTSVFNTFIGAHPEYAPENDPDGVLWEQFKAEFNLYQPPQDPKTLQKVLNKVHSEVAGVQPAKNLKSINASKEKIKVASHRGASANKNARPSALPPKGIRTDGLKGFSQEEIDDLMSD